MIYGTKVFLESMNTNLYYSAIIFNLDECKNTIETTSSGLSSPPWLIKNSLNLYKNNEIEGAAPLLLLSQISSFKFIKNRILEGFFDYEIPAIELCLGEISEDEKIKKTSEVIKGSVELFSKTADTSWEHHFLIIRLFGSYHIISERTILHIVIPTIFLWLLFIFVLIFVNRRLKRHTWYTIGKVWWSVPLTFFILVGSFFLAGMIFNNLFPNASYAGSIYGQLSFQIITGLFFCFIEYLLILFTNYGFEERAIDYLLVISCIINQSLFILADISLSPIFIMICMLSLIALTVKNNPLHFAIFLLMVGPLIPYGHRVIAASELNGLSEFIKGPKPSIMIPLVLYPVYIVLFRILTSIRTRYKKVRTLFIFTSVIFVSISFSLILLGIIRTKQLKKLEVPEKVITYTPYGDNLINLSYTQKNIFGDVIRTIDIELPDNCLLCDLLITTDRVFPVLYSDNDYTSVSNNAVRFRIPDNPPEKMTFSYGAALTPCKISVTAIMEDSEEKYLLITKSIEAGER